MKMRVFRFIPLLFLFIVSEMLFSQNCTVRGTVYDAKTGEEMPGVTVMLEGTTYGTMSDLDGKFSFNAPPGTYTLRVSYISYTTVLIENVVLKPEEVCLFENISLKEVAIELTTVTITAEQTRNTETSLQTMKMKSPNMLDGISAVQFKRTGDSDAASSVKRVPGISINDGKYVYVRGLGDRYTKTILNGVDIPGLDPDRNTIQMDIFPTNIIDNIVIHKSFRAELPADFTGGVVDIETKDFPEQKTASVSVSAGYNPMFHFQADYLTADGGSTDFLGFDDGSREIPAESNIPQFAQVVGNPDGEEAEAYRNILTSFNPNLSAYKKNSLMDFGFSMNYGNQVTLQKHIVGYNFAFSYKNDTEFYEDAVLAKYGLNGDRSVFEMDQREYQRGNYGLNSVFLNGLAGFAIKTKTFRLKINLMHLQNGESSAGIFDFIGSDLGSNFIAIQHNIDYNQRSLTNLFIEGKMMPENSKWQYVWKISPSFSKISDPDIRFTRYEIRDDQFIIGTESGFPERIWRNLQEYNITGVVHVTRNYSLRNRDAKLLFGASHTFKQRDFNIRNFALNIRDIPLTGNPDELFYEENLWPYNDNPGRGTTFETPFIPNNPNQFSATINTTGTYLSTEISLFERLKTNAGIRIEYYSQNYTGQDQLGINVLDNANVLSEIGFFPALNLIYNIAEKQNFRASYSKTIARPSFKELSYAEIYDPISGTTFIGGIFKDADDIAGIEYWDGNLTSSDIHNADVRWEIFGSFEQTLSLSGFYKYFINPIEIVQYATQSGAIQPRNVGNGSVLGIEVEFRKNLFVNEETLSRLSIAGNLTFTQSEIKLSKTEFDSRTENARQGEIISDTRDMAGQSPYIINGGILYQAGENKNLKGLEVGLFYNVQGQTLLYAGIADRPDIYTVPFHGLNFNSSINLGKENNIQLGIKIDNLLNSAAEIEYKSYMAEDQLYKSLKKGRTFQMKFSYKFH